MLLILALDGASAHAGTARFIDDAFSPERALKDYTANCSCTAVIPYFRLPDSEWQPDEVKKQLDQAREFYATYCIFLSYRELTVADLPKKDRKDFQKLLDRYARQAKNIPKGKTESGIEAKLRAIQATVQAINAEFARALKKEGGGTCALPLVLFLDEWFVKTGEFGVEREYRVSAFDRNNAVVGMDRYDRNSPRMLAHELLHALKNPCPPAKNDACIKAFLTNNRLERLPEPVTWESHYGERNKEHAISCPGRKRAFQKDAKFKKAQYLTLREYATLLSSGVLSCVDGCAR